MRKICRFGQDGLHIISDDKGLHSELEPFLRDATSHDSPLTGKGIHSVYDFDNNEVIFTFLNNVNVIGDGSTTNPTTPDDAVDTDDEDVYSQSQYSFRVKQ